jgi:ssDNA-specific exonuclease RecJ
MYLPLTWNDEETVMNEETVTTKKLVLVEALSVYRMRYVIECNEVSHAADTVAMNEIQDEFSQMHLTENVISSREIDQEEYLKLFNEDNSYLSTWTDEEKFKLVHKIDYDKQNT